MLGHGGKKGTSLMTNLLLRVAANAAETPYEAATKAFQQAARKVQWKVKELGVNDADGMWGKMVKEDTSYISMKVEPDDNGQFFVKCRAYINGPDTVNKAADQALTKFKVNSFRGPSGQVIRLMDKLEDAVVAAVEAADEANAQDAGQIDQLLDFCKRLEAALNQKISPLGWQVLGMYPSTASEGGQRLVFGSIEVKGPNPEVKTDAAKMRKVVSDTFKKMGSPFDLKLGRSYYSRNNLNISYEISAG